MLPTEPPKPLIVHIYEDGFKIRSMTLSDVPLILDWFLIYSEGTTSRELEIILSILQSNSPGFYIGEYNGEAIASAISVSWGDDIYLEDYYFTKKEFRGCGFSLRLREQIQKLYNDKAITVIDSVQGKVAADNSKMFGYKYLSETAHYQGKALNLHKDLLDNYHKILKVAEISFDSLISYDNKCFVTKNNLVRREFLKRWFQISGGATYVAVDTKDQVKGYGCRIPSLHAKHHHVIGPLYADDQSTATALVTRLCADVPGETIDIVIRCANQEAVSMMETLQYTKHESLDHMYASKTPCDFNDYKDEVYGITSLVVCAF